MRKAVQFADQWWEVRQYGANATRLGDCPSFARCQEQKSHQSKPSQLHCELAGELSANLRETKRLRLAILQVEAVMRMLSPEMNLRLISSKRRNVGNPWFKRRALARGEP
jgi:hypothetical protein